MGDLNGHISMGLKLSQWCLQVGEQIVQQGGTEHLLPLVHSGIFTGILSILRALSGHGVVDRGPGLAVQEETGQ